MSDELWLRELAQVNRQQQEDEQTFMWLEGIPHGARVIVQGQDFVREGQRVEALMVEAAPAKR